MEDGTPTPMNAGNRAHPAYAGSRDKRKRKVGHSSNSSNSRWRARLQGASGFVVLVYYCRPIVALLLSMVASS